MLRYVSVFYVTLCQCILFKFVYVTSKAQSTCTIFGIKRAILGRILTTQLLQTHHCMLDTCALRDAPLSGARYAPQCETRPSVVRDTLLSARHAPQWCSIAP